MQRVLLALLLGGLLVGGAGLYLWMVMPFAGR